MRNLMTVLLIGSSLVAGTGCTSMSSTSPSSPSSSGSSGFKAGGTVTEVPPGFSPLADARIEIVAGPGLHTVVTTDAAGKYTFGALSNANYTFKATREGYQDSTKSVLLNRDMSSIDILLYPLPPNGATARCKTSRGVFRRTRTPHACRATAASATSCVPARCVRPAAAVLEALVARES